jgi:hypothetical protein
MVSEFMNSLRIIYLDGRPHSDPDIVVPSWNGESIGRWEGRYARVDTKFFTGHHHWVDSGFPPAMRCTSSSASRCCRWQHSADRIRTDDAKSWEGTWKYTKRWRRVEDRDIAEVSCLPDLNEHMPTTKSGANVR